MSPLYRRMIEDMQIRNLSTETQRVSVANLVRFACHFRKSPERLGPAEIWTYLIHLTQARRLAAGSIIFTVSTLRFFFTVTLNRGCRGRHPARPAKKLLVVPSQDEVAHLPRRRGQSQAPGHPDRLLRDRPADFRSCPPQT